MGKKNDKTLPRWMIPVTFGIAMVSAVVTLLHTRKTSSDSK